MALRRVVKKRVGPEGIEIDCDDDQDRWVDIKETQTARYERGRGRAYQKTIYTQEARAQTRKYDDPPKITFKNPNDENQKIEYLKDKGPNHGTIRSITIEAGRGRHYQKTIIQYENNETSSRKVREQKVENPETGDFIMVERIEKFRNEWGRGRAYQKKIVTPANDEENIKDSTGPCKFGQE